MKNIFVGLMLLFGFSSFAEDKNDKSEQAFKTNNITAIAAFGVPSFWVTPTDTRLVLRASGIVAAEYQVTRAFNTGLQYAYYSKGTGMQSVTNRFSHTPYKREKWTKGHTIMITGDYCYLNRGRVSLAVGMGIFVGFQSSSYLVIDSVGISTRSKNPSIFEVGYVLRLTTAKVRVTDNLGVCGGISMSPYALLSIGAHYTFNGKKK